MRRLFAAILLVACLGIVPSAGATLFGASDDRGKYDDDGGAWFFAELAEVGLGANKMTVNWDPSQPDVIAEKAFLDRSVPKAAARGIHLSFGIHIGKARAITDTPDAIDKFVAWLQELARAYPEVTEYVVGNEPNLTRFWQPQFDSEGRGASGIAYAAFLARGYDALKEVNPNITVVGLGLSPRGNDMPNAPSNISTSPVKFIRDVGIGYGRMARDRPLMDVFGFHPYPARDRDPLGRGYPWPNAGVANLDRIKQAVWDAFHGSGQPTFAEPVLDQERPLVFKLDEVGWQVDIPSGSRPAYFGKESVKPTDEGTQARIYGELIHEIACDPSVRELLFFGLIDEPNLDRWQAALVRADKTRRPAWDTVQRALSDVKGAGCLTRNASWKHTEKVVGAEVKRVGNKVRIRAEEDAIVTIAGRSSNLKAYRMVEIKVSGRPLVKLVAAMNRERVSLFR
jgi:hypothetical protein